MGQPKLIERVRNKARLRHLSHKTEYAYVNFISVILSLIKCAIPKKCGKMR